MKRIFSILIALMTMFTGLWSTRAEAATKEVSGTVNASTLTAGDDLVLTGDTKLVVNVYMTLSSIKGDYNLEIVGHNGGSATLTISSGNKTAISVKSLKISSTETTTGAYRLAVNITSGSYGILADYNITMPSGVLRVVAKDYSGIRSTKGNIDLTGSVDVSVTGRYKTLSDYKYCGTAIYADEGNITLAKSGTSSTLAAKGEYVGIYARQGTVSVTGGLTAEGTQSYGI